MSTEPTTPVPTMNASGTALNEDPFVVDVDHILDSLRAKVLNDKPNDVLMYISSSAKAMAADTTSVEQCERIVPKVTPALANSPLTIVVLGASGDLAKKMTFPALFQLYCGGYLPPKVNIVGYARTKIEDIEAWKADTLAKRFTHLDFRGCHVKAFLDRVTYLAGSYDKIPDFQHLNSFIADLEAKTGMDKSKGGNRLFYLALPPTAFVAACTGLHEACMPPAEGGGWVRVIIEKPFGRDTETSAKLSNELAPLFAESQIYRIDHYLGKEMVQNIVTTRFANRIFSSIWNSNNIACVQITFKETIGTEGRGGYFDSFGIIRDVVQNHLTQMLALAAMEKPRTLDAECIRDEKVSLLRCIAPVTKEDCVLGQYTANEDGSIPGYLEDPTVPQGSKCPTFVTLVLHINNDRWQGVPIIIKAGKALEKKYVGIRIQFKDEIRPFYDAAQRNELVIRAQPSEAMYMKITTKTPGLMEDLKDTHQTELDLTYRSRYNVNIPEAYESLINDAIQGNSTNFVRKDELDAAWRIFTPLLHQIDKGEIEPIPYVAGSRGPQAADDLMSANGFKHQKGYNWIPPQQNKL